MGAILHDESGPWPNNSKDASHFMALVHCFSSLCLFLPSSSFFFNSAAGIAWISP